MPSAGIYLMGKSISGFKVMSNQSVFTDLTVRCNESKTIFCVLTNVCTNRKIKNLTISQSCNIN